MELYPHQRDVLTQTWDYPNAGYFLDMGLGKTLIGSERMLAQNRFVNLVVCQKSKVEDWIAHFASQYRTQYYIYDLTKPKQLKGFLDKATSKQQVFRIVGVINYELLFRRPELRKLEGFTLLLDESSLIQNEQTKRAKFILSMNYDNVILLSGSVVNGNYEKLYSQCHLLGWPISKDLFYRQYCEFETVEHGGFKHRMITGYKNVERLKRKMREYGAVFVKTDEVLTLPPQRDIIIEVPQTDEYKQFRKDGIIQIQGRELIGDYQLTKRMYEKMLCAQYSGPKLSAFRDLVESTDDRLIVFYWFDAELYAMQEAIGDLSRPFSVVNGKSKDLTAYEKYPDSITFIQYQAGAHGLNLQKANKIVYFSLPDGWSEGFEQSRKRIHRIGQNDPCTYFLLVVKDSIECEIMDTLDIKKERTDYLFTDEREKEDCEHEGKAV